VQSYLPNNFSRFCEAALERLRYKLLYISTNLRTESPKVDIVMIHMGISILGMKTQKASADHYGAM
jgi:hypothetical protein